MVGRQGIEPRMPEAPDLQSSAVANAAHGPWLERVGGIEPPWPAWKAGAQPMSQTRIEISTVKDRYFLLRFERRKTLRPGSFRVPGLSGTHSVREC